MAQPEITILYDGACPICRREIGKLRELDRRDRMATIDIAAPGFDPAAHGLIRADVQRRMHGILPSGEVVRGMEAIRRAYRAAGRGWIVAFTGWPGLRPVFDRLYNLFARNRMRLGRWLGREEDCPDGACAIDETPESAAGHAGPDADAA